MGMFGGISRALGNPGKDGLSIADKMALFGALYEGNYQGAQAIRNAPLQRAQKAQQDQFLAGFQQKLGPQYAESAPVQIDESGLATPGAEAPNPTAGFQLPQRTSNGMDINSPDLARILAGAPAGVQQRLAPVLDVLKAQQPDVKVAGDGTTYNGKSMAGIPQRFATPQNINGWNIDQGDPKNRGGYFPKLPDGMIPDGKGGVVNTTGLTGAMGAQEEATTLGKTRGTMMNVPVGGGRTRMMTGGQYLGGQDGAGAAGEGVGVTQSPDDATYAGDIAKASAAQYTGIQTAGQNAAKQVQTYARIKTLLAGLDGGRLSPMGVEIASAANSLGIKVDPKLGNKQAAQALMNQIVLDANGGSLGPGVSNADVTFLAQAGPNLMQSADGRQKVLDFAMARAQRAQTVARFARQWQAKAGRLDKPDRTGKTFADYLDAYAAANPLVPAK